MLSDRPVKDIGTRDMGWDGMGWGYTMIHPLVCAILAGPGDIGHK